MPMRWQRGANMTRNPVNYSNIGCQLLHLFLAWIQGRVLYLGRTFS